MNFRALKLATAFVIAFAGALPSQMAAAQSAQGSVTLTIGERAGQARYTVRPGDTLSSIARSAGVPLQVILALNPRLDPRFLRVGDIVIIPDRSGPIARQSISVQPTRGPADADVLIEGRGFRPNQSVRLLAGPGPYDLRPFERLRSDSRGRVRIRVELPEWARPGRQVYFGLQTPDLRSRVVSEPFRVVGRTRSDRVTVTGTITRRGVECPVMRGDDGQTYSLTGRLDGFGPGDRVHVEGRLAEMSFCMQGTTIEVRRISEAD